MKKIEYIEFPVLITYAYHKAYRGTRDGRGGPPLEPDEPAWIEVDPMAHIMIEGKKFAVMLSDSQVQRLEEDLMEDRRSMEDEREDF